MMMCGPAPPLFPRTYGWIYVRKAEFPCCAFCRPTRSKRWLVTSAAPSRRQSTSGASPGAARFRGGADPGCRDHESLIRFYSNIEKSRKNFISDSTVISELSEKNEDPIKKIEQLSKLKDKGIITLEEFEKSKKKLLDSI